MSHEDFLKPYLPKNKQKRAVVVGAHEGLWVKQLAPLFDDVVAIEASPQSCDILESLKLPNVHVMDAAAWVVFGYVDFHVRKTDQMRSAVACRDLLRTENVSETIAAKAIPLDYLSFDACDLIMIDVQGAEVQVVMGATGTIERYKPDLIIECHEIEHRNWIMTWLERCGYNVAILHEPEREINDDWYRHVYLICTHYRFRGAI